METELAGQRNSPPRLHIAAISKAFGPARVLVDCELNVAAGEVHALVGQNGSGKSTLIKILTGYFAPDGGGTIAVDGQPLRLPINWDQARRAGISVVHQDLGLLDQLTVAENICVGDYIRSAATRRISVTRQNEVAQEALRRIKASFGPTELVANLNTAQRAEVAIARALRNGIPGKGVVILDESTRAFGNSDRAKVHEVIRRVADHGTALIIVSHDLDEVLDISDRVTVLRDGHVVGMGLATSSLNAQSLARLMLGRTVGSMQVNVRAEARETAASVRGLAGTKLVGLDLDLHAGEVVGLTGVPGCGFEEVPYLIAGARQAQHGRISIRGRDIDLTRAGVHHLLQAGVTLVPERRDRDGLAMELSLRDNLVLPLVRTTGRPWFASRRAQHAHAQRAIARLDIRPPNPSGLVKELSGGNQQKALLAKWLATAPKVLVLHEATQAVDIGARFDLLHAVRAAAAAGIAVLFVSIEASDLAAVCDRVVVYGDRGSEDRPRCIELRTEDPEQILHAVYGGVTSSIAQENA